MLRARERLRQSVVPVIVLVVPLIAPVRARGQEPHSGSVDLAFVDANHDGVPDRLGAAVTMVGVLTARIDRVPGSDDMRLQDATRGVELRFKDDTILDRSYSPGDVVEVAGVTSQRRGAERLEVTSIRWIGRVPPLSPRESSAAEVTGGQREGTVVRLEGKLVYTPGGPEEARLEDSSGNVPISIPDELVLDRAFSGRVLEGRRVSLTGVAEQSDSEPPFLEGYRVSIDEESDIEFTPVPPYRTIILGIFIVGLIGGIVYLYGRRRLAERRSREMTGLITHLQETQETLKSSQDALRHSEEHHRSLIDHAPFGVFKSTPAGRILVANSTFVQMLGYESTQEMVGLELGRDVFASPDDWTRLVESHTDGGVSEYIEAHLRRRDGNPLLARILVRFAPEHGERAPTLEGFVEDVTERQQLEDKLRQSQKMEAVGQLAGGIAHDFNNLLTVILASSDLLLQDLASGDPCRESVEAINHAGQRAGALTQQLLAFSRRQPLAPQIVEINEVVQETTKLVRRIVGEDVELQTHLTASRGQTKVDPGQLHQVLLNLVVNARDAMPNGGKLMIETSCAELDESEAWRVCGATPGEYVVVSVSDTGTGMSEETRARVFEPFFTTKDLGKGTGLGLATVYGIIKQSNGYIEVDSELGSGSTFRVYLPLVRTLPSAPESHPGRQAPRGSETILLVEDELLVRSLARRVLQRGGYRLLEAGDGEEALRLMGRYEGVIDVILTDVVMPKMSGRELAERAVELRPGIKTMYMSGYTDDMVIRHGIFEEGEALVRKPFTPDSLLLGVRSLLDGSRRTAKAVNA